MKSVPKRSKRVVKSYNTDKNMTEVFKQSFNYASIKLYKNYSNRDIKCDIYESDIPVNGVPEPWENEDEIVEVTQQEPKKFSVAVHMDQNKCNSVEDFYLFPKNTRTFFHATDLPTYIINHSLPSEQSKIACDKLKLVNVKPIMSGNPKTIRFSTSSTDVFLTTKSRHIKRHYNNPFAFIQTRLQERWIKENDEKIVMKSYYHMKTRKVNCVYFSKSSQSTTLTFNKKTGNFTVVIYSNVKGKPKKNFYCNSFTSLRNSLSAFYQMQLGLPSNTPIQNDAVKAFDHDEFHKAIFSTFGFPYDKLKRSGFNDEITKPFINNLLIKFAELKKIKLPDNGWRFLKHYYPTEQYLRKNDRKLIASVLEKYGIKSNFTIKILHEYPDLDLNVLRKLCMLFGENYPKYIANIDDYFFSDNSVDRQFDEGYPRHRMDDTKFMSIKEIEKQNVIRILNDIYTPPMEHRHDPLGMIYDHFKMLGRISDYFPDRILNARTWKHFTEEHTELSDIERSIQRGSSIHKIYEEDFAKHIESPITIKYKITPPENADSQIDPNARIEIGERVYTPVILRTTEEYKEEGKFMHHCVAGYIEGDSIIISLRSEDERVTNEFRRQSRVCEQSRYFKNDPPPSHFEKPLQILRDRMKTFRGTINVEKKRVPLVINGITVKTGETVLENNIFDMF